MKRKRFSVEQIAHAIAQAESGAVVTDICRQMGVSEPTFYRWKKKYSGMGVSEVRRLKQLEEENLKLKRLVANLALDNAILKEAANGKLLSPARRRAAVEHVQQELGVSERRACRVLGQARAVQRHAPRVRDDEDRLTGRIIQLAAVYGRYGTPRITAMLRREGLHVNHKRVERIWRREGLRVPRRQPRRGRLWLNDGSCVRLRPERKDHVWAYDFVSGVTHDGRPFRMLVVVDEFTRECLAIDVARKLSSDGVLERLAWLMATRGVPEHVRSDNGAEFTATVVREWLAKVGVKTLYIEPGSPWENGYVESFNGKLRDELLSGEIFSTLQEAKVLIERWRKHYNTISPHSSLGYRPPAPETVAAGPPSAPLRSAQQRGATLLELS
ncbi:MAG: IS3 family transposase [Phycisphaerales bacterium]